MNLSELIQQYPQVFNNIYTTTSDRSRLWLAPLDYRTTVLDKLTDLKLITPIDIPHVFRISVQLMDHLALTAFRRINNSTDSAHTPMV
jgi:hypothetical protein